MGVTHSILTREAIVRAIEPGLTAAQARVCDCLGRGLSPPTSLRLEVTGFPEAGRAVVRLAQEEDEHESFLACLGHLEARFPPFEVGSDCLNCGDSARPATAVIHYPFVVEFTPASGQRRYDGRGIP